MSHLKKRILELADQTVLTNQQIADAIGCSRRTVLKYAGSHTERCKDKTLKQGETDLFEIQRTVLLPDIHHPHYEQRTMEAVDQFIFEYNPHELIYMGDQITLDCISSWNKRKPLLKEGKRLLRDYDEFNKDILLNHENITSPDTRRTFMIGNHEERIYWYSQEHPELDGFIDIERHLCLGERGYKIIPYNEIHKVGKLNVIHGYYYNKYHAAKTLEAFEGNVVYSHVHNPQMYAKVTPMDRKGYHMATALPCLCNIRPDYKQNAPNFWINGFGIVEHMPATGQFNLYTVIIVDGTFMYNGRVYGK
jgi:hypothetical protein